MKKIILNAVCLSFLFFAGNLFAQNMTGLEIMQKNYDMLDFKYEYATLEMTLINSRGKKRNRNIKQYIKTDKTGNRSVLIRFLAPADVKGTGFLSLDDDKGAESRWLYLPVMGKSRRISANSQTDSFMGSDFTYEDIEDEDIDNFSYKLTGTEAILGAECYIVEAIPANNEKRKESGYAKRIIAVGKENFMVHQIKYFDKKDNHIKTYIATDIRKVKGTDKWRTYVMEAENHKTNHKTIVAYDNYQINAGTLSDDLFTKRYLESEK